MEFIQHHTTQLPTFPAFMLMRSTRSDSLVQVETSTDVFPPMASIIDNKKTVLALMNFNKIFVLILMPLMFSEMS